MEKLLLKKIMACIVWVQVLSVAMAVCVLSFQSWKSAYAGMSRAISRERQLYEEYQETFPSGSIPAFLHTLPTAKGEAYYIIDNRTHEIFQNEDNDSRFFLDTAPGENSRLLNLGHGKTFSFVRVEGSPAFSMIKELDAVTLILLRAAAPQISQILWIILGITLILGMVALALVFVIRRCLKKYIFDELNDIQLTARRILSGDETAVFHTENQKELGAIIAVLNDWSSDTRNMSQKLDWAIGSSNPNVALFEGRSNVKNTYCSTNLQAILGLDDAQWNAIKDDSTVFMAYIIGLLPKGQDSAPVNLNGKSLDIKLHRMGKDYFGMITDNTPELEKDAALLRAVGEAGTDELSGLFNRRGFEASVQKQLSLAPSQAVMLMMDVDNFKRINDTFGHPVGDRLLSRVGQCLRSFFPSENVLARLGGDEFAIFLQKDFERRRLEHVLETLLSRIREELLEYADYGISISIGAAALKGPDIAYSDLYQAADSALYDAKRAGKDQFRLFSLLNI